MAYSVKSKKTGTEYYLHGKPSKNGNAIIYFFAKDRRAVDAVDALPDGYELSELEATGLPYLKKLKTT